MSERERWELRSLQSAPLKVKIALTQQRIREWVNEYGVDGVYVAFSGGKDSTVLLDIVRKMYPTVKGVFCDTGLEFPEIRDFVGKFDNIDWLKPEMTFKQVINRFGYPFISKESSEKIRGARKYLRFLMEEDDDLKNYLSQGWTIVRLIDSKELQKIVMNRPDGEKGRRYLAMVLGMIRKDGTIGINIPAKERTPFMKVQWQYFLDAPFEIGDSCCRIMKKDITHKYQKDTGRMPMTAQMACESKLRTTQWLQHGCNGFELKNPISNPMAFWLEQDVLLYAKIFNLSLCPLYGDIVGNNDQINYNYNNLDICVLEEDYPELKTTGYKRTGCMFCGFGCQLEPPEDSRFTLMAKTHPKQYNYIMRPIDEGGLNYKQIIDWINEHLHTDIRY